MCDFMDVIKGDIYNTMCLNGTLPYNVDAMNVIIQPNEKVVSAHNFCIVTVESVVMPAPDDSKA